MNEWINIYDAMLVASDQTALYPWIEVIEVAHDYSETTAEVYAVNSHIFMTETKWKRGF